MRLQGIFRDVLSEHRVSRALFQITNKFLPEFAAIFFVASNGTKNFEHLLW